MLLISFQQLIPKELAVLSSASEDMEYMDFSTPQYYSIKTKHHDVEVNDEINENDVSENTIDSRNMRTPTKSVKESKESAGRRGGGSVSQNHRNQTQNGNTPTSNLLSNATMLLPDTPDIANLDLGDRRDTVSHIVHISESGNTTSVVRTNLHNRTNEEEMKSSEKNSAHVTKYTNSKTIPKSSNGSMQSSSDAIAHNGNIVLNKSRIATPKYTPNGISSLNEGTASKADRILGHRFAASVGSEHQGNEKILSLERVLGYHGEACVIAYDGTMVCDAYQYHAAIVQ